MCDTPDNPPVEESNEHDAEPPFNVSVGNRTAIENVDKLPPEAVNPTEKEKPSYGATAGSDSGVEVVHGEYGSSGAPEALSCASSLISCGSGCEDSVDALSSTNGLDGLTLSVIGDGTSEGGSESSSVTGSGSAHGPKRSSDGKKKVSVAEPGRTPRSKPTPVPRVTQCRAPALATRERARSREKSVPGDKPPPPTGPKPAVPPRNRPRATPDSLALVCRDSPSVKVKPTKTSTVRCRTPGQVSTPTSSAGPKVPASDSPFNKTRLTNDSKAAFDKYATLPRRKRENSPDLIILKKDPCPESSLYRSINIKKLSKDRDSPPLKSLPPYPRNKFSGRIKIYHETSAQTALCGTDVEKALAGVGITEIRTDLVLTKKSNKSIQVDTRNKEIERLEAKVKQLTEANSKLQGHCDDQAKKITALEGRLEEERADKIVAQEELQRNTERVLSMLGGDSNECGDSLLLLESQLQSSANVVMKQQEEMNKLHNSNKELQQELNKTVKTCRYLEGHLEETEQETNELQEFLQAEKNALQEALRDSEENVTKLQRELIKTRKECRLLVRISEQRRHEILAARAKLAIVRPVPATPVALPVLAQHLQTLLHTLINSYNILPDDLEDIIFHNEAYSRSVSSEACSPGSPLPHMTHPLPGPSSAPCAASRFSDDDNSADLLDSETEPCLMMENILEDVALPDTYSHNFVAGLSIMSCPNVGPHGLNEDIPLMACPISNDSNLAHNRRLFRDNKEDSFSSLHNITTFSGDELSPAVPDEKPVSESSYYPEMETCDLLHMGYSEHDSLQNLSQAILQRQQSEAECSMSEDIGNRESNAYSNASNPIVDQVLLVDNLIAKLLKVLRMINCNNENNGHVLKIHKERINDCYIENGNLDSGHIETSSQELSANVEKSSRVLPSENSLEVERKKCAANCEHAMKWCSKTCASNGHVNNQKCAVEQEQSSPKRSVTSMNDCSVNSPKVIDSAA